MMALPACLVWLPSFLSPHKSRPLLAFVRFVPAAVAVAVVTIPYQAAPLLHVGAE